MDGEPWVQEEMERLGALFELELKEKPNKDPINSVKSRSWWPFIPVEHFVVPLLHCLIGVGDNVFSKFRTSSAERLSA